MHRHLIQLMAIQPLSFTELSIIDKFILNKSNLTEQMPPTAIELIKSRHQHPMIIFSIGGDSIQKIRAEETREPT